MEIEIFTLADFAQDYGNGKLVISGTFDTIFCKSFPATHGQCSIAIRMRVANSEAGKYPFTLIMLTPEKKELVKADGSLEVKPNAHLDYSTINLVLNLNNTVFEKPGKYAIELHLNNQWERGLALNILKMQ